MNVLFNLPARENEAIRSDINRAVQSVLDSGYYLLGEQTRAFEQEFAAFCRVEHCLTLGNGTDALEIAMRAIGVSAGDEVITVANAGGYTTTACNLIGAVPVYVDVEPDRLLLDIDQAVAAVSEQTRCVVATHLYGQVVDIPQLRSSLDRAGYQRVRIVEDCAQAHGASQGGRVVGSMADIATYSFYPTKNLGGLGDGGAIVTGSSEFYQLCLQLRQYGWSTKYQSATPYGRNSRMDELQAAVLRVKLNHLPACNARRREVAMQLARVCQPALDVVTEPDSTHAAHLFVVRHPQRRVVRDTLAARGIATDIHYPILDQNQHSMRSLPYRALAMPNAERAADEIFSLPCYAGISDDELTYMCTVLAELLPAQAEG